MKGMNSVITDLRDQAIFMETLVGLSMAMKIIARSPEPISPKVVAAMADAVSWASGTLQDMRDDLEKGVLEMEAPAPLRPHRPAN